MIERVSLSYQARNKGLVLGVGVLIEVNRAT
jgi:hypothetical protein